jgi:hypothetical protein
MWQPFEWVDVEDRLPCAESGEYQMLICDSDRNVFVGSWNGRSKKFFDEPMGMAVNRVTHWAMLPDAPKS